MRIDAKRALYKNATLAISMRFHSIAFAMYHAVPLIGICYAPKAKQLMKEYGLADFSIEYGIRKNEFFYEVFDIDENELDRVKQKVIGMIDSSELEVFRKASKRLKEEAAISVNILEEALDSSR